MDLELPQKEIFYGPATLWKRLVACLLDLMIIDFFVLSVLSSIVAKIVGDSADFFQIYRFLQENTSNMHALTILFGLIIFLNFTYFVLMQYLVGQTVGCIILDLYVVDSTEEAENKYPTFWQSMLRNLFLIPVVPFVLLLIADPIYYYYSKSGQRLTEWLSKTSIVEKFTY